MHILVKLGPRSRDEVLRAARRHVGGGLSTLEDRGWVALSVPAPGPSTSALEGLAGETGCLVVLEWAMDN